MMELLDYDTSPLNPALKIIILGIFLVVTLIYLDARKKFGGDMLACISLLFFFSLFMTVGCLFRYFGHGTGFGFTSDYSLKWLQSLAYLAGAICLVLAARKLHAMFRGAKK